MQFGEMPLGKQAQPAVPAVATLPHGHSRQLLDGDDYYSLRFPELCQGLQRP